MEDLKIKILAVDDNIVNIKVLSKYLVKQGYEVVSAESGIEAIEKFKSEVPDIILMDIMMENMDGVEATSAIKTLSGDKWIPIIFMSALSSDEDKIKGLEIGGDDYITKPIEFNVLGAKLNAIKRIVSIQHKLSMTMQELQQFQQAEDQEQEMAYELMEKLFDTGYLEGKEFHVWHVPASRFSGDLIIAEKYSEHRFYLLHADSTGHGLAAALPLLPISQTFYHMAKKGHSIGHIAKRMNSQLKTIMPINRFVAVTLLLVDFENNIVEAWNGGNPPAIVLNENKDIVKTFDSTHLALGILPDESFDSKTDFSVCEGNNSIVLYSDGLTEAENIDGQEFGEARFFEELKKDISPPALRDSIAKAINNHLDGKLAHDDMSLIVLNTQQSEKNN